MEKGFTPSAPKNARLKDNRTLQKFNICNISPHFIVSDLHMLTAIRKNQQACRLQYNISVSNAHFLMQMGKNWHRHRWFGCIILKLRLRIFSHYHLLVECESDEKGLHVIRSNRERQVFHLNTELQGYNIRSLRTDTHQNLSRIFSFRLAHNIFSRIWVSNTSYSGSRTRCKYSNPKKVEVNGGNTRRQAKIVIAGSDAQAAIYIVSGHGTAESMTKRKNVPNRLPYRSSVINYHPFQKSAESRDPLHLMIFSRLLTCSKYAPVENKSKRNWFKRCDVFANIYNHDCPGDL